MRPGLPILLLVLCATAVVAGACGDDRSLDDARRRADPRADAEVAAGRREEATGPDASAEFVGRRQAAAIGRQLDALAAAFAPVSARINFLVAAETLREDAMESKASDQVELERTGTVRLELRRTRTVLVEARPAVAAVSVRATAARNVQQLLLAAIDARLRALTQLEATLDGISREVGRSIVDARFERYRAAWEQSVRSTREATTAVQDERARIGLEPAPEEALR
jgi:hypothetical protein